MPRYKLLIAYDGTGYQGWQRQPSGRSIQGALEATLFDLFDRRVDVVGSGRTDAGVHALGQVAHVDLDLSLPPKALVSAMNSHLPMDIRIRQALQVPETFHARYSAVKRAYIYLIRHGGGISPFTRNYALHMSSPLNLERMNQAASLLVGEHDFSAFRATGGGRTQPIRMVFTSKVFPVKQNLLCYLVVADAFLRKMVRGIVGTLLEIGLGKSDPDLITRLLTTGNRTMMGTVVPPQGLFLAAVTYPPLRPGEEENG
ncbi:MAG: tRNA pseudouridine(38-40) synthase TruA [Deltaproteobacteria bacterium]|nr:MAG: tRNA pseudouridine(38-40) synthase TruA [Deltaproteobacteria bacterium]